MHENGISIGFKKGRATSECMALNICVDNEVAEIAMP